MNTNSNVDQRGNTETHSANQGVKSSTFISSAALTVALLGVAAGWLGHKPAVLVRGERQATEMKVVPQAAGTGQGWHVRQDDSVRKGQLLVSLENQELQTRLGQDRAATGSANERNEILRASWAEDICVQSNWWLQARAVAEHAQETVDRSRELQAAGVISLQELQAKERDLDLARSSERAARANFDLAVALCDEVERLAAAVEHAGNRTAELEGSIAELTPTSPSPTKPVISP